MENNENNFLILEPFSNTAYQREGSLPYILSRCTQRRSSKAISNGAATMEWKGAHCQSKCLSNKKEALFKLEENINEDIKSVKYMHHTLRPWGIDGAGRENLPLATTAWNNQRGENTILQELHKQLKI